MIEAGMQWGASESGYSSSSPLCVISGISASRLTIFLFRHSGLVARHFIAARLSATLPTHSNGLFSVFDTELIRSADVYTGGYNADYGGRISSMMDITYKDGNKKRFSGSVGASTFGARALIEGPISKQKSPESGSASFVLSFKNSYLEESSKIFYSYIDEDGLPFNFTDFYGKVSLNAANGSKVSFFGFSFNDRVDNYKAISSYGWNSFGGGANFVVIPGKSPVLIEGVFAYSQYESSISSTTLNQKRSLINGFNGGLDFTYFFGFIGY